jgi:hypothetical protein
VRPINSEAARPHRSIGNAMGRQSETCGVREQLGQPALASPDRVVAGRHPRVEFVDLRLGLLRSDGAGLRRIAAESLVPFRPQLPEPMGLFVAGLRSGGVQRGTQFRQRSPCLARQRNLVGRRWMGVRVRGHEREHAAFDGFGCDGEPLFALADGLVLKRGDDGPLDPLGGRRFGLEGTEQQEVRIVGLVGVNSFLQVARDADLGVASILDDINIASHTGDIII